MMGQNEELFAFKQRFYCGQKMTRPATLAALHEAGPGARLSRYLFVQVIVPFHRRNQRQHSLTIGPEKDVASA
jgi:hypothetical protein